MAKAKTGSIQTVPWRGGEVFACPDPTCSYAHELKDRVEEHVGRGKHTRNQAPTAQPTAPEETVDAPEAETPTESETGSQEP